MKKYIWCFLAGLILATAIMVMVLEPMMWGNARLSNANNELRQQKVILKHKLDKANKYNNTLTYNMTYNMIRKDKEIEELRK